MQIVYHLGAHCTDDSLLVRVLLRNHGQLLAQGTAIPHPDRYPALLRAAASAYAGRAVPAGTADELLDALLPNEGDDHVDRVVLSFDGFLALQRDAVTETQFYPAAGNRARGLAALFPQDEVELLLAIRNPATWLPALSARRKAKDQDPLPQGFDGSNLRWSELVRRITAACPEAKLTIWCDEDSPLISHAILRAMAGHDEALELKHALDLTTSLMDPQGAKRMLNWFAEARPDTDAARQESIAQFLERFALPEKLETEIDMPGWDAATVAKLTADYEADCESIAAMPNVNFLRP